jgi:hypothetical protein
LVLARRRDQRHQFLDLVHRHRDLVGRRLQSRDLLPQLLEPFSRMGYSRL